MRIILTALFIPVLLFSRPQRGSDAYDRIKNANALYRAGTYDQAIDAYEGLSASSPPADIAIAARFNLANTLYMTASFREAASLFSRAAEEKSADEETRAAAFFNAGNALAAMAGRSTDRKQTHTLLRSSLMQYRQSLLLNPNALDAKINTEIVLRRIQPPPPASSSSTTKKNSDRQSKISSAMKERVLNSVHLEEKALLKRSYHPPGGKAQKSLNKNW